MNDFSHYAVNFDQVAEDTQVPAFLRLLAQDIMKNGYVSVGKFYESLTDYEIEHLISEFEYLSEESEKEEISEDDDASIGQDFILLTLMLCQADGTITITEDSLFEEYLPITGNFAIIESLYRAGLVDVVRENYSYSDANLVVAKKI